MLGGRVREGDIKVEVEKQRWGNVAPIVSPNRESMGQIKGLGSWGGWNIGGFGPNMWTRISPIWTVGGIDGAGNRKWSTNFTDMEKKVYSIEGFGYDMEGVPGKYYTMEIDVRTAVTAMNGHPDYVPQPPCRYRLYATNGNPAQDVIIAESSVINPILPEAPTWPFHPGYREWRLALNAVQPMPVGKTYFRLVLEYDNNFNTVKDIWLPASFTDNEAGSPITPPQLYFFQFRYNSQVIYEHTGTDPAWKPSSTGTPNVYDWEGNRVYYSTAPPANSYWEADFTITQDDLLRQNGFFVRFWAGYAESNLRVWVAALDGDNTWSAKTIGATASSGRHTVTWAAGTGPQFHPTKEVQRVRVRFYARAVQHALIAANGTYDDFDGKFFYKYHDVTDWVTKVEVERYDTEVSSCSIALRERANSVLDGVTDPKFDNGDFLIQGRRIRISAPQVFSGQTSSNFYGIGHDLYNTLFVGSIEKVTARYPRKARKEAVVYACNRFTLLQEKTYWAMKNLEDYSRVIPALGLYTHYDNRNMPPWDRDPFMSLTGFGDVNDMWQIRDEANGFTLFDALQLTRNSQFGFVYFDRWDRLHMKSLRSASIMASFNAYPDNSSEDSYADIDISYDSTSIINSVRIIEYEQVATIKEDTFERDDAIVQTESTIFDLESIKRYRKSEIEFKTFKKSDYNELRTHVLDKYSVPAATATRLIVPIRDNAMLEKAILIDIYSLINVKYQDRLDTQHRVNRIKHTIVPGDTWVMELGFGINHDGVYW